jgi:hypothetical protein
MPKIVLGPVVGRVTESAARILVETDAPGEIAVRVAPAGGGTGRTLRVRPTPGKAFGFEIDNLRPDERYTVRFEVENGEERQARVHTADGATLRVAAVSCHDAGHPPAVDLWAGIADLAQHGTLDAIFHMGDQVYADQVFDAGVRALRALPRSAWPQREAAILEDYRDLYRTAWSRAPVQRALAQASNLMIWDDHEVVDGFGDRTDVTQPNSAEHFVAGCGWRVFHEYQRQLWDAGAERAPAGAEEGFWCRWGQIAALFLDVRGGRGFRAFDREQPEVPQPLLSPAQWARIRQVLIPHGGPLDEVRILLVVSSLPVVYAGKQATEDLLLRKEPDDVRGHWAYKSHAAEQHRLLTALRHWKEAASSREVVLLGGGVHLGSRIEISYATTRGPRSMQQIIASPVHREPEPASKLALLSPCLMHPGEPRHTQPPDFTWRARSVIREPNYALLELDAERVPSGVSARLVTR